MQARKEAQEEVREEMILQAVTAEEIIPVENDDKNQIGTTDKPFCRRYWWLLLIALLVVGGGVVGGVLAAASSDNGAEPPSRQPSFSPSTQTETNFTVIPSLSPSNPPSFTNEPCAVGVTIGCDSNVLTTKVEPCDEIIVPDLRQCDFDPYEMTFRFNGGSCAQSQNLADRRPMDSCQDFGNISTVLGTQHYLVVESLDDNLPLVSEHTVAVGDLFTVSTSSVQVLDVTSTIRLPSQLQVTIYDNAQARNALQDIRFTTSCTSPRLFLLDRFGSIQYVSLRNEEQGNVTVFVPDDFYRRDISMILTTYGLGTNRVRLDEVNMIVNFSPDPEDFGSRLVGGPLVDRQVSLLLDAPFTLDLSTKTRFTAFVTVIGSTNIVNDQGEDEVIQCNGFDFYEFTAGSNIPPIFNTEAPTPITLT